MDNPGAEYVPNSQPSDVISSVNFGTKMNNLLLATSWDKVVRLYNAETNTLLHQYNHDNAVLDACFTDTAHAFSAGMDNTLVSFDFNNLSKTVVGRHEQGIKTVKYCPELNCVLTGSLDKTVKIWDCRTSQCLRTCYQSEKVFAMDTCGEKLVVGTAGNSRRIVIWDIRNMYLALQKRESSLKCQTRALKSFPDNQGFVMSSMQGRVAVNYIDSSPEIQKNKYVFKCHRIKENGQEIIYPVHAISFHPIHSTFATGGADGFVNIWDKSNRKKLCQFHQYPAPVTSLSFNETGTLLAIAVSPFQLVDGVPGNNSQHLIILRKITDIEAKPKKVAS